MPKLAALISVTLLLATPASAGWRDQRIDGTDVHAFERSVVLLLNELPRRRREDFEIALAVVWLSNTADAGDLDHDGDADLDDVRLLREEAADLLAEIKRGDLVSAIEEREQKGSHYTSVEYLEQLDGLQFDDVLNLAGQPSSEPSLAALKREIWCKRSAASLGSSRAKDSWCGGAGAPCPRGDCTRRTTLRALNAANDALKAQRYAEARAAIERLDFDRLNQYERSGAENILAQISYGERDYVRTREHLQNAIDAGGLTLQEAAEIQRQITLLDSQSSASPQPPR